MLTNHAIAFLFTHVSYQENQIESGQNGRHLLGVACLQNKKVRKELGQHTPNEELESLQRGYNVVVDNLEIAGFNPGILDAVVPTAVHVEHAKTAEEQVEQLLSSGKAFSVSGQ